MKTHRTIARRLTAGFSLIEIVIAMTIVAILGATVIKLMSGNIDVAKEQAVQADIDGMSTQLMV